MKKEPREMSVALLRGINVGGKNILPMSALIEIFRVAGCTGVKTYIQSGNVVFQTPEGVDVASLVTAEIAKRLGLTVSVVLRTAAEIDRAIAENPFVKAGVPAEWLHVLFLAHEPTTEEAARLDPARSPGDEFVIAGREIYLHLPNGAAKTKLTNAYVDAKLKTVSTQRNWRTVLMLAQMMHEAG